MTEKHWSEETNWKRLGDLVRAQKQAVEAAHHECREDDADEAHDDLLCMEWRLRAAERRRG